MYETFGPGFTLLALGADAGAVQSFRDAAATLKLPLGVVEEAMTGEVARYEASLVLVRPDHFVAWNTDAQVVSKEEALKILERAIGATGDR